MRRGKFDPSIWLKHVGTDRGHCPGASVRPLANRHRRFAFGGNMKSERGAVALEFAIGATVLFSLLIAIIESARVIWQGILYWGALNEVGLAASLCPPGTVDLTVATGSAGVALDTGAVRIDYLPIGCSSGSCQWAKLSFIPSAVLGFENAWWPLNLLPETLTVPVDPFVGVDFSHPFCPH